MKTKDAIPIGWKMKKTGELCKSIVPGRYKPKSFDGNIPWIRTEDLNDYPYLYAEKIDLKVNKEEIQKVGGKLLPKNTVIMTCVGNLGLAGIAHQPSTLNQQLHAFICKDEIIPKFLMYSIIFNKNKIINIAQKTAVLYLNQSNCDSIPIIYPPIEVQKKIVNYIFNVDEIIKQTQQLIEQLQLLKKGLMQRLFTEGIGHTEFNETRLGRIPKEWEIIQLSKICKIIMGQSPPSSTYNDQEDGIPFFQGNADFGIKHPSVRIWCNSPKKFAEADDILISVRAPVGAINVSNIRCSIGRGLASIRIDDEDLREYIFNYLTYNKREFNRLMQGSTFEAINKSDLINLKIKKPTKDSEIKMISQFLSNLNNTILNEINYLEKVKEIKKALMQQLLIGKKRVTIN